MIIILKEKPEKTQFDNLVTWLKSMNLKIHLSEGEKTTILGLVGDTSEIDPDLIAGIKVLVEGKIIDASLRKRFDELASQMNISQGRN